MFHKEGTKIIFFSLVVAVIFIVVLDYVITIDWLRMTLSSIILALLILVLQFFRNPNRSITPNDHVIVAPVDGKVVVIEEVYEPEYFKDNRLMVSIFMSPINVHVTRYGLSGLIKYSQYHAGKYLVAWHPKASEENERTTVVIENNVFGEVMYRQIAGALAKRIINYAKPGMQAIQGTDAGFIKFGSRVDLYLPIGTKVDVVLNQKAIGNKTVIAKKQ
ncbi:phosphatidylserine decarboxylase [Myroides gitamensis]|uniref:Phosphatidylserine decarboxylase proenzyme n=1 Tax=Myroides odoratus TaxID=256 RepID=A0A378U5V8_MYROD|nr:phosphatidylserine decarboxylase family protein [Myroides odoratus]MCS4237680.1 phosphatidylserine decarboxylase [Myroides odoratus]MDH6601578.1 phosphatidylserine decarboxylase [Myroides gitamensis]QQU02795.1 phosphatidylserine decarboxylase family protein [Myroides odoratus]STZ69974.1 phosphatidylserine decarboxylase [Myroides odoratus]